MDVDRGAIWITDLAGVRSATLVVSNTSFARRYRRVLLAPDARALADEPRRPGWVGDDGAFFDVTRVVAVPVDRLLEHSGAAAPDTTATALRIMHEALR